MDARFQTIIEPFKIQSISPIPFPTEEERETALKAAHYNVFQLPSDSVIIDLLTDSGTAAMSSAQWAAMILGDEAYAGSRSFYRFEKTVRNITGYQHILPTHQGRAAERILFSLMCKPGMLVPSNGHFDTTKANILFNGAQALDLFCPENAETDTAYPFKGNMDVRALARLFESNSGESIPLCMLTITNNAGGGQPVSMENIRQVSALCRSYGIPLIIDACRFAENAYFIKTREHGYAGRELLSIAQEMFSYADGCTMSAKKDGMANIGGFLALNDDKLAQEAQNLLIITEGFSTYGGLAGRDLEAIATGLSEALDEHYLRYRLRCAAYMGEKLTELGVPVVLPTGGHAIYLDARRFYPHIPPREYPGQTICVELYRVGGVRGVEIGSVMFGGHNEDGSTREAPMELVRLALPRRVYTQSHIDYVIEVIGATYNERQDKRGYRIVHETPYLRHFTARFEPL